MHHHHHRARRLLEALEAPMRIADRDVPVQTSIGVASTAEAVVSAEQLPP